LSRRPLLNASIGEYRVEDFLGAGGMGEVYRAIHSKIGRVAAVKVLTPAALDGGGFTERFLNEARIQAGLQHPNIATLYDFLEINGQPCIIMEYVDGLTLSEQIRTRGPLPPGEMLRVFQSIIEAIRHVHSFGIIHRDIKANNVKLSTSGQVKLLDFGIAKAQTGMSLTETGAVIGTIEYLSPEQLSGGMADARSDIWALGVLLYQMATGCAPFAGKSVGEVCLKIVKADYPPPTRFNPSVPPDVGKIISRCLKQNPTQRYQTAQELLEDVSRLAAKTKTPLPSGKADVSPGQTPAAFNPAQQFTKGNLWVRRNKLFLSVAASTAALLLAFIAFGLYWMLSGAATEQHSVGGEQRIVRIDVVGGRAEIHRDGRQIGKTPFSLETHMGEHVKLTLKRDGYADEPLDFTVTAQTKNFSPTMKKIESDTTR
jgi:serine/threonine-protein kinase